MSFYKFMGQAKTFFNAFANSNQKECYCSDSNGFYITKREASIASSIIITLLTISLIIGYLWGQRSAINEFSNKVINDSLADQVNYSMYSMYGESSSSEQDSEESDEKENIEEKSNLESKDNIQESKVQTAPAKNNFTNPAMNNSNIKHFANLIGFGSKSRAEEFVKKLQKKGYNVLLIPRKSKTSKNKTIIWYQITTDKFDDKAKLDQMVNEIKDSEHLNDIKFMTT